MMEKLWKSHILKTEQSETSDTSGQSDTKLHVLKVWQKDQEKNWPASIQVDLLRTDRTAVVAGSASSACRDILPVYRKKASLYRIGKEET